MRRSVPGKKTRVSKRRSVPKTPNTTKGNGVVPHDPDFEMQYGCSRKTGEKAGGYFWNPPSYCESPRIECDKNGDRWVKTWFCKTCKLWLNASCPARKTPTRVYENGFVWDTPKARAKARKKRRRS